MTKEKKAGRPIGRTVTIVVLIAAIIVCVYSAYNIVTIVSEDNSSDEVTQTMRSFVRAQDSPPAASQTAASQPAEPQTAAPGSVQLDAPGEPTRVIQATPAPLLDVDFAGLQEINPEIRAWIDIPDTDISYPVVQGDDNDYYLTHSYDGTRNRAGAIFLDSRVDSSFTGLNTIVYGHRMNNGSMFGRLYKLADTDYRSQHQYIHVYLPGQTQPVTYEIFATWESPASLDSAAYQTDFTEEAALSDWLAGLAGRSFVEGAPGEDPRILTLSTCVRGDGDTRFIVAARKVS